MEPWTILLDGDDTQWECGIYYRAAEAACFRVLHDDWPDCPVPHREMVITERRIQRAMLRRNGFFLDIFESGWVETFRQLSDRFRRPAKASTIEAIRWAAGMIHHAPYSLFPGVIETLACLRARGHELHLVTLGEYNFQWRKINRNNLAPYHHRVHVVQHGKQLVMRLASKDPRRTLMVGDSIPSDMVPAKRLGFHAAWVHAEDPWYRGDKDFDFSQVHTIQSINQVPDLINQLNSSTV